MRGAAGIGLAAAGAAGSLILYRNRRRTVSRSSSAYLGKLIRSLPHCTGIEDMSAVVEQAFGAAFGLPIAIFLSERGRLSLRHHSPGFTPDADDFEAASCCLLSGRRLRRERSTFLPLTAWTGPLGVLGYRTNGSREPQDSSPLIQCFISQTSSAVLRYILQEEARRAGTLSEADRFQKALLDSIAHNTKTPLASIIGALSTLDEDDARLDAATRRDLVVTAREQAQRLNRLLNNLLDMSRLESGAVRVRAEHCDIQDVIGAALEQLGAAATTRQIEVVLAPDLPLVAMDFVLIVQVLVNLLDNALKYSPGDRPIRIEAHRARGTVEVCVADDGDGIPECDLACMFEKFTRAGRSGEIAGIGLGLSICKGLIEAHNGTIRASRREPRGTAVSFRLPVQEV